VVAGLLGRPTVLRALFVVWGVGHLVFGVAGAVFPRWFFAAVPPWPPLHVGQIQIAGIFDLAMATAFLVAATDVDRYAALVIPVGVVAEGGHAAVRIGHVLAGRNPAADLFVPGLMLLYAVALAVAGVQRRTVAKAIPAGWHSVTPRLVAHDPARLVEFLREAFGGSGDFRTDAPSQIGIGDSIVMVSGVGPRDATAAFLYLYVADVDGTYRRALDAGAVSLEAPRDMPYGDRRGMVEDPCGNVWQIATYEGSRGRTEV
jgi:PhnB protein